MSWHNDKQKHSLASRGIKSNVINNVRAQRNKVFTNRELIDILEGENYWTIKSIYDIFSDTSMSTQEKIEELDWANYDETQIHAIMYVFDNKILNMYDVEDGKPNGYKYHQPLHEEYEYPDEIAIAKKIDIHLRTDR